jgi:hypothetical protein
MHYDGIELNEDKGQVVQVLITTNPEIGSVITGF